MGCINSELAVFNKYYYSYHIIHYFVWIRELLPFTHLAPIKFIAVRSGQNRHSVYQYIRTNNTILSGINWELSRYEIEINLVFVIDLNVSSCGYRLITGSEPQFSVYVKTATKADTLRSILGIIEPKLHMNMLSDRIVCWFDRIQLEYVGFFDWVLLCLSYCCVYFRFLWLPQKRSKLHSLLSYDKLLSVSSWILVAGNVCGIFKLIRTAFFRHRDEWMFRRSAAIKSQIAAFYCLVILHQPAD